jgi:hypothetical protein
LVLAGIAALFAAPQLMRHELPLPARALWIGLLAISPAFIYYSRTARPYALLILLGPIAILAFRNWQRDPASWRRWLPLYVSATFVAGWLHILSVLFTLWPFVHYGAAALRKIFVPNSRAEGIRRFVALVVLALLQVFLLALVIAPPLLNDWGSMREKTNSASVNPTSLLLSLLMQIGVTDVGVCAALVVLGGYGALRMWQRDRDFTALILGASLFGVSVICLMRPAWIQHAPVLIRYTAAVAPFWLLFIAVGLAALCERLRSDAFAAAAGGLFLAGLLAIGPIRQWAYTPNQFIDHAIFQFDYAPSRNPYATLLELGPVSTFYADLAQRPARSVTLIEVPRRAESNFMPDPWLQAIHRQNVKYALAGPLCGVGDWDIIASTRRTAFVELVDLDSVFNGPQPLGDYLVLNLERWSIPPVRDFPDPIPWPDMASCVSKVRERLGEPIFRDAQIVVFALSARAKSVPADAPAAP